MKGKIEIFYDMPLLAEYLERTGKKLSEDDVKSAIEPMVHEAVVYHLNDCTPMITSAALRKFGLHSVQAFYMSNFGKMQVDFCQKRPK